MTGAQIDQLWHFGGHAAIAFIATFIGLASGAWFPAAITWIWAACAWSTIWTWSLELAFTASALALAVVASWATWWLA